MTTTTPAVTPEDLAAGAPDERVTSFHVRDVALTAPDGTAAGTMALITMDNGFDHTKPTTYGPNGLLRLRDALDAIEPRVAAGELAAVGITGKPFIFGVGADLKDVGTLTSREQALAVARLGHDQLRRLGELAVPSFAFVNGAAMGGGVEVALHCTYRTISSSVPAVALPECFLGLVPGWGGTYLLPRLIGPAGALEVMVSNALNQNRMLTGVQAFALGIADVMLEPADFLEQSLRWAASVVSGATAVERHDHTADADAWATAVAGARGFVKAKLNGAAPAPARAIDLVESGRTADRDAGFAAEDDALADLIMSDEFRSGIYAFDLVQRRAKRPVGAPDKALARPVTKVGVVGAGLMASQLALLFARRLGVPVVMTDLDQSRVDKGVGYVHAEVDKLLGKKRVSPDAANRLKSLVTGSTSKAGFADADFVIEAVFEEMSVKQQVFAEVEAVVTPECVLATNTSSLSVTEMASKLEHPERVVGFHFFNPVAVLPLLEVVKGERTDDAALATAFAVGKTLKKSCVLVKDAPAFVVNRLLTRFLGEVIASTEDGTPVEVADRALAPLGLPMSPFVLVQLVGPAVALHTGETLHAAFPERFGVSQNLQGASSTPASPASGRGTTRAGRTWTTRPRPLLTVGDSPQTEEQVRDRALSAVAQEIGLMLDEGVVAEAQDIDLCMVLGAGWPFHLGGITPYLDRTGVSERVVGRRFHAPGVASVPA